MHEFIGNQLALLPSPRGLDSLRRIVGRGRDGGAGQGSRRRPVSESPFPGDIPRAGTPEDYLTPTLRQLVVWEDLVAKFNGQIKAGNRSLTGKRIEMLIGPDVSNVSKELFLASLDDSGWGATKADYQDRGQVTYIITPKEEPGTTPGPIPLPYEIDTQGIPKPGDPPRYSYNILWRMEGAINKFADKFSTLYQEDPHASSYTIVTRFDNIPTHLRDAFLDWVGKEWGVSYKKDEQGKYTVNLTPKHT